MMVHANLDGQVGVDGLAAVNCPAGAQNGAKDNARLTGVTAAELAQKDLDVAPLRVLVRFLVSCCIRCPWIDSSKNVNHFYNITSATP